MSTHTRLVTADELLRMPDDGYKYELVEGRVIRMPPPGTRHGVLSMRLGSALCQYVDERGLGAVSSESGYKLRRDPDTVRGPDVSFIRADRISKNGIPAGYWQGPPDLVVEVLSPDDRPKHVAAKIEEYLRVGVRLVWVVDPDDRTVTVHRPHAPAVTLTVDDDLSGGDVVEGFTFPLSRLFA